MAKRGKEFYIYLRPENKRTKIDVVVEDYTRGYNDVRERRYNDVSAATQARLTHLISWQEYKVAAVVDNDLTLLKLERRSEQHQTSL